MPVINRLSEAPAMAHPLPLDRHHITKDEVEAELQASGVAEEEAAAVATRLLSPLVDPTSVYRRVSWNRGRLHEVTSLTLQ